jgi:Na+-driven multidrug efflux pump
LAFPFAADAIILGVFENARVAILGHLVGTPELSAYVLVMLFVGLTTDFVGGFYYSLATLLSHSIGAENSSLTGQYLQLSIIYFVLFSIPFVIMWYLLMEPTLLFLGLDSKTAKMGQEFTAPVVFSGIFHGVNKCFRELMETTDYEITSMLLGAGEEIAVTVAILIYALYWETPSLTVIGYLFLFTYALSLCFTVGLILFTGWFKQYYGGLFHSCALSVRTLGWKIIVMMFVLMFVFSFADFYSSCMWQNWHASRMLFKTAAPIACGYLLAYGEWEVLAFLAA